MECSVVAAILNLIRPLLGICLFSVSLPLMKATANRVVVTFCDSLCMVELNVGGTVGNLVSFAWFSFTLSFGLFIEFVRTTGWFVRRHDIKAVELKKEEFLNYLALKTLDGFDVWWD